ncbi:MAG: hypothetical protein IAE94_13875 [Chthoniobacterales bacterium]|nr:hypothetical protein [Chthoniobacterales bacterium]
MLDIRWNPTAKDLRGFGWVIGIGFGAIGLLKAFWPFEGLLHRNFTAGMCLLAAAVLIGGPAMLGWRVIVPAYWAWMGIAWLAHKIMFPVMFGAFYYIVFFPIGLLMRLVGHDPLRLKRGKAKSCWIPLESPGSPGDYERQF